MHRAGGRRQWGRDTRTWGHMDRLPSHPVQLPAKGIDRWCNLLSSGRSNVHN